MASEIVREDIETVAITLRGNIGITTKKAEVLSVDERECADAPVAFAANDVTITLSDADLAELRALIAAFEPEPE